MAGVWSTHRVELLPDRVVKRYRHWDEREHEREWQALTLLQTYAPGLAPAPLDRLPGLAASVVGNRPGKSRRRMSRSGGRPRPRSEHGHRGPYLTKENLMAKYLLLKHYRSASQPAPLACQPIDQWTPEEVSAHMQYMADFATRLEGSGEFVDGQALYPDGVWVRYDGEGRPPVTDGPFAETKDLIAGWMVIDVDSYDRAIELAGELSAAPGAGGEPIHEWLEVRPFMAEPPTITE